VFGVQSVMQSPPPQKYSSNHGTLLNFIALSDFSVSVRSVYSSHLSDSVNSKYVFLKMSLSRIVSY
jgi:hypothetical protein